jgi:uncharacterized protein
MPVIKWPDKASVDKAAREWAVRIGGTDPNIMCIGYFGSYARGDCGVGSDLDMIVIVENSRDAFDRRAVWDATELPVPAELVVYTIDEWRKLQAGGGRFVRVLEQETVWIYESSEFPSSAQ